MRKYDLSQEALKVIACFSMLIDHTGAILMPWDIASRVVGRLAFPIFCFLIAEGACHTRNTKRYAFRLLLAAILAEPAFDMAFYHEWSWQSNNVMITLLLGFLSLQVIRWNSNVIIKSTLLVIFVAYGDILFADYGSEGVLLIILFYITRNLPGKRILQAIGMTVLFYKSGRIQMFALASLIPISLYSGKKLSSSKSLQNGFYLFYPVHLWALYFIERFL